MRAFCQAKNAGISAFSAELFAVQMRMRRVSLGGLDGKGPDFPSRNEIAGSFAKSAFWVSLGMYSLGAFFAYAALPILRLLG